VFWVLASALLGCSGRLLGHS